MSTVSRRAFLRGAAGLGAAGALGVLDLAAFDRIARAQQALRPVAMAMHVHSSFSEGTGSMLGQLAQADANGVEVVWWTDHDWRMSGHGYRQVVHFDAMTEADPAGGSISWVQSKAGSLSSSSVAISSERFSPTDPVGASSLRLAATGKSNTFATMRVTANASASRENLRGSIAGQTIVFDVFPEAVGPKAFLEIRVKLSHQPATGGRPEGEYSIMYRIGGSDTAGTHRADGLKGYVGLGAPIAEWSTITLTPTDDIALLWPDLVATDSTMRELSFAAGSKGNTPSVFHVDHLRFQRSTVGDQPLLAQRQIMTESAVRFPDIVQHQGLEVSLHSQHINWFGSGFSLPDYGAVPIFPSPDDPAAVAELATLVHATGGLSSLNHPLGSGGQALVSQTKQDNLRRSLAKKLIASRAYGVDMIEAGYAARSGVGIGGHLSLWDCLSRNAMFLTGTGVNDSHGGPWLGQTNSFLTWAWAEDAAESNLIAALAAGRIWFAESSWRGAIDLAVDGVAPMGSASVSGLDSRELTIVITDVPVGGSVRVVRGPADLAGATIGDPGTTVTSIPAADLAAGSVTVPVDTASPVFVRAEVLDGTGRVRASSNPVWLLRAEPPGGIPAARSVV